MQLYLYAQSNGRSSLTFKLDEISSTSIRYTQECSNNINQAAFGVFHLFCLFLPIAFYFLTSLILQSCWPRIRKILGPSTPRNSVNQNYTALVLIGLIFSLYTLVLDVFALKAVANDHTLRRYEKESVHQWTTASISFITIFDSFATLLSFINIFLLTYLNKKCIACKSNCIIVFFFCCLWKRLKCEKSASGNVILELYDLEDVTHQPLLGESQKKQDLESETITWLLMISFMAQITCLGTHSGFIVIAWTSDPAAAGSMTIFFVLSFVYYYFGIILFLHPDAKKKINVQ